MTKALAQPIHLGDPMSRVDGPLKVTGGATYAAEYNLPGVTFGVLATSTITRGRITRIDVREAERSPGVLAIVTHENRPAVPGYDIPIDPKESRVEGQEFRVFYDNQIYYNNQPVALVVADTFERATYAASLVKVTYAKSPHQTNLKTNLKRGVKPKREDDYLRGKRDAYKTASVRIEQEYQTPINVHNPMEPHAATAVWEGTDKVTVYNKTQATKLAQKDIMRLFQLPESNVQIHSPFVGGAFGSSSRVWPQEMAAILGAKQVGRPVKVALKREQAFNMVGYRPRSTQKVGLGVTADGTLVGLTHEAFGMTSTFEQFTERIVDPTKSMYAVPNLNTVYKLVPLDLSTPCWTRGPGEASGSFALESAMDELAYALRMDPVELRIKNFAATDPEAKLPWSSNQLKACYERGAKQFGWSKRDPNPRSMRSGDWLVGMGMSAGIYKAARTKASASARLMADGTVLVRSSTADVGPGTYTIMTQIAASVLGLNPALVRFELGDSSFPPAPGQFGSHTTASVGSAVHDVCVALQQKLLSLASQQDGTPLHGAAVADLMAENGQIRHKTKAGHVSYADVLKQQKLPAVEVKVDSESGPEQKNYSSKSFCATFVEVHVHPATGEVRMQRVVSALDVGKVVNQKTAHSQVHGCVAWGIGMALMEEGILDHRYGRYTNNNLAEYHLPVCADIPDVDVILIDEPDTIIDPIGAKGMGEIGLIGFAAAIANAVYHATGKRVRDLPITPDKLIG
ncbi:xanthine dehydrogenase family protein molybdopterin-binding subunit [Spirosoma sp. KUDC1026]|uniref:xanthine dehydrogenase family protein molybdopterin-binding subunit n=1 Tax=Spirosoma sp. KUDC1026 TaxID=2745947 RepID=UPI00159B874A|nr:xanthine dehydrogenase family protein molybdopterin-binding subunit [Spirosoma sp. KUDC1026]QKZ12972.1 xanthine dehydrogenase family protein molybdopterin-binding subunit [Spirosoma sp. KUDC1026]